LISDPRQLPVHKFAEPVALSSTIPVSFPLARTTGWDGFSLLALRARRRTISTTGRDPAQAVATSRWAGARASMRSRPIAWCKSATDGAGEWSGRRGAQTRRLFQEFDERRVTTMAETKRMTAEEVCFVARPAPHGRASPVRPRGPAGPREPRPGRPASAASRRRRRSPGERRCPRKARRCPVAPGLTRRRRSGAPAC
jgi:hypothetical protein